MSDLENIDVPALDGLADGVELGEGGVTGLQALPLSLQFRQALVAADLTIAASKVNLTYKKGEEDNGWDTAWWEVLSKNAPKYPAGRIIRPFIYCTVKPGIVVMGSKFRHSFP